MGIFSILFVIASVVFSVTSSVIAAKKARRAKKKAEAEADARKGFEIVVDGEIRALPIIYGRAKVGGVRTFHKVINRYENYISNADKVFEPGHLTVGTRSDKPVYLIFDQVLSKREITTFYDFIIDDKIVLEIKRGNHFCKRDFDQVIGYLKASGLKLGILAIFSPTGLRFKRVLNIK